MIDKPARLAGNAFIWQFIQMTGVKVIFLLRILILARLLIPDDFGLLSIAVSAKGLLLGLTNFGLMPALIQGQNTREENYHAAWTIGVLRGLLLAVMLFIGAPYIAALFAEPRATPIIQVFAAIPILEALTSIKIASLNRMLLFRPLAILKLIEVIVHALVSIGLAKTFGVWALVAGLVAAAIVTLVISYIVAPYRPQLSLDWEAARPIINFGRWIFLTGLISLAAHNILRIVISRQLGANGLGLYYLATQLAFLPAEVASEMIGNVAFPLFARLKEDIQKATRMFEALFSGMAALLFPVCTFLIVLAPIITRDVFGPGWQGTEQVIQVLALTTMIGLFGEATSPVLKGFGQPHRISVIEFIQSLILVSLVWILTSRFGLVGAASAWLPAITISQFISAYFIMQALDRPFKRLQRPMVGVLAITTISTFIALIVSNSIPGLLGLIVAGVLGILSLVCLFWYSDRRYALGFTQNLSAAFPQIASILRIPSVGN
jgi:O-antigen/teichoic acid export membrane protein